MWEAYDTAYTERYLGLPPEDVRDEDAIHMAFEQLLEDDSKAMGEDDLMTMDTDGDHGGTTREADGTKRPSAYRDSSVLTFAHLLPAEYVIIRC